MKRVPREPVGNHRWQFIAGCVQDSCKVVFFRPFDADRNPGDNIIEHIFAVFFQFLERVGSARVTKPYAEDERLVAVYLVAFLLRLR